MLSGHGSSSLYALSVSSRIGPKAGEGMSVRCLSTLSSSQSSVEIRQKSVELASTTPALLEAAHQSVALWFVL